MADQDMENLKSELSQLRSDLRSVTESVRELAAHRGESARERLREAGASARERATQAEHALESQIEERPLASVLVVFIGGLITGLLLQSRR